MCQRVKKVRRVKAEARRRTDPAVSSCDFTRFSHPPSLFRVFVEIITCHSKQSTLKYLRPLFDVALPKALEDCHVAQE